MKGKPRVISTQHVPHVIAQTLLSNALRGTPHTWMGSLVHHFRVEQGRDWVHGKSFSDEVELRL